MKIYTALAAIQAELKAPKSQFNKFGNYKYRKAEDILEAVKPLAKKNGCALVCTDELVLIGSRYYVKATATIIAVEDGSQVTTTAYAREEEEKKGMDGSQVTGASSSYARKYALNGLLCIDDTADSDTTNQGENAPETPRKVGAKANPKPAATAAKKPAPERWSETWNKWVEVIATNAPGKDGKAHDWNAEFRAKYEVDDDIVANLTEDVFNRKMQRDD